MGNNKKTYEMGLFDGSSLPNYDGRTELADNVPLIQLIDVRSHVIGFTQIEVDVLLGHSSVHF